MASAIGLTLSVTRWAGWANVVVGVATVAYVWGAGALDLPHYVSFASLETLACLYVAWSAWRWRSVNAPAAARLLGSPEREG